MSWTKRGVLGALALLVLPGLQCSTSTAPPRRAKTRVFIMGFDGMDPTLARRFMDEGKLPHLKAIAERGTFAKLESTQPSESPVAWASFATGVNPGKHNIFDFLVRDTQTYMPDLAMVKKEPPRFLWGLIPIKPPVATSTRGGTSFWVHAGRSGIRSVTLTVPVTWPPESVPNGDLMGGLPLPDMRGTIGTFLYWGSDLSSFEETSSEFGGILRSLLFDHGVAVTSVKGPDNPILKQEEAELKEKKKAGTLTDKEKERLDELSTGKEINIPLKVRWSEGQNHAVLEVQGTTLDLKAGDWSPWVPLTFRINWFVGLHGMAQFHVIRADKELQIYCSPVNMDPRNPPIALSKPDSYSKTLAGQVGLFRTLGWAEANWALNESRIDEGDFLYDCEKAFEDREKLIFKSLERDDWDLMTAVIETTDRISHMMFRLIDPRHPMYDKALAEKYGDSIEKIYERADALVGKIEEKLPKDTVLLIMSDHGFHSFRRGVNLNTWLVENNYLAFQGVESSKKGLADLFGRGQFWEGVDWSRTKAYALGLGQIYVNLRGREGQGIVSSGADYTRLQDEIVSKLGALKDPDTGEAVFGAVYKRDDMYKGEYLANAPDLQVGFNDGYRVGWQDSLGGIRRTVVENNNKKWSGDHCATAVEISGGVFFGTLKINTQSPSIMDISPTVLKLLGVPLPGDLDGKPLI
jgi:predicted AlkP superfamily phosphohydrolase/phosphomutase